MTTAFRLLGDDCGIALYEYRAAEDFCAACGVLVEPRRFPVRIGSRKRIKTDLVSTDEGVLLVSPRLMGFLQQQAPSARFVPIESKAGTLHVLTSVSVVAVDPDRRPVLFRDLCPICSQFLETSRTLPTFLRPGVHLDPGDVYVSDIVSGSKHLRSECLIVGAGLQKRLVEGGFSGLYFDPVWE